MSKPAMTNRLTSILTKAKLMEINLEKDGKFRSFEPEIHYSYNGGSAQLKIYFSHPFFCYHLLVTYLGAKDQAYYTYVVHTYVKGNDGKGQKMDTCQTCLTCYRTK